MGKPTANYRAIISRALDVRYKQRKYGHTRIELVLQDGEVIRCKIEDKDYYKHRANSLPKQGAPAKWCDAALDLVFGLWRDTMLSGQTAIKFVFDDGVVTVMEKDDSYSVTC